MENKANIVENKKNREIPDFPHDRTYNEIAAENDYLGRRVVELLALVTEMEKEKKKMEEISDLNDDMISSLITERDEQCKTKKQYMDQLEECRQKIKELEDERDSAKKQAFAYDGKVSNNATTNGKLMTRVSGISPSASSCDSGISMNIDSFNDRLVSFQYDMERKIENMIDDKLSQKQFGQLDPFEEPKPSSHLQVTPERYLNNDRERNLIIHGLKEEDESTDRERINEILRTTNTELSSLSFYRLGGKKTGTNRPIMVRMQTITDKEEFMSKLWMLKQLKMKKLSITNDYTMDERKIIKQYVEEAKKRNNNTGTHGYVWKVRGTPRNGMRLIKFVNFM